MCNFQKFDNEDCSSRGQSQSKAIHITTIWFFIMGQPQPQHNVCFGECFGKASNFTHETRLSGWMCIQFLCITKWHNYFRETIFYIKIFMLNNVAFDFRKVTLTSLEVSLCITYIPSSFKLNTNLP